MDIYQLLALFGGALIVLSTLPQAFKTLRLKEVGHLSLPMFAITFIAEGIWLFYGFHINDIPLILTNAGAMAIVLTNIILILRYRDAKD